jgi:hypothetical protein
MSINQQMYWTINQTLELVADLILIKLVIVVNTRIIHVTCRLRYLSSILETAIDHFLTRLLASHYDHRKIHIIYVLTNIM